MNNQIKGILYVALSGVLYGFVGYFGFKALESSSHVMNMLFWRFLVSALFIGFFLLPKIKQIKVPAPAMFKVFVGGGIFYSFSTFAYFEAISHLSTGVAMTIFFTYPAFVVLINWLVFKTRVGLVYIWALSLITLGLILLIELQWDFDYTGLVLSLLSGAFYAMYIIFSKKTADMDTMLSSCLVSAGCSTSGLICSLITGGFTVPSDPAFWTNVIGLGIISTALPIVFLFQGIKYISSQKAAILGVFEPVFVVIVGVILLGEALGMMQLSGVIILLTGAVLALISREEEG